MKAFFITFDQANKENLSGRCESNVKIFGIRQLASSRTSIWRGKESLCDTKMIMIVITIKVTLIIIIMNKHTEVPATVFWSMRKISIIA